MERLSWEESIDGGLRLVSAGSDGRIDGQFPLSEVVLQVVDDTEAKGILCIHPLYTDHVACHFSHSLPEPHEAVVEECPSVAIGCASIGYTGEQSERYRLIDWGEGGR